MLDLETVLNLILTALFTGIGSGLGMYIANKHLIDKIEKVTNKLKDGKHD
jgi:hypothetical protein